MIGTATLVISVSVGEGVRVAINEQFRNESGLRQISVFPDNEGLDNNYDDVPAHVLEIPGEMSEEKRERIRKLEVARFKQSRPQPPKPLMREKVEEFRQLPHVVQAVPELEEAGRVFFNDATMQVRVYGAPFDLKRLRQRLEFGRVFSSPDARECLVHEIVLYRLGIRNDAGVAAVIGKTMPIELTNTGRAPLRLLSLFDSDLSKISPKELEVLEKVWKMLPNRWRGCRCRTTSARSSPALSSANGLKPRSKKR